MPTILHSTLSHDYSLTYFDGDTISKRTADYLNYVKHKEIEKKIKKKIEEAQEAGAYDDSHFPQICESVISNFIFQIPSTKILDPVEREAYATAKEMVLKMFERKNINHKSQPEGKIDELTWEMLAKHPEIRAHAEKRVNTQKFILDIEV